MKIDTLSLTNFRNYEKLEVTFSSFLNVFYGLNGSGKTNLVEAIYLLALSKSFRVNNDKLLIKKGKLKAKVSAEVNNNESKSNYEVDITNDGKTVLIDNQKLDKISDYISKFNVILFNPSNTRLIDDAPVERRKLLNVEISQLYKEYLIVLNNYNKILKQRNFYLRGMYINNTYVSTYLDILTKKLVEYGMVICRYREKFINGINEIITDIYKKIFGCGELKIRYSSSYKGKTSEYLVSKYQSNYQKELSLGKTIDGIHHDDIVFILDNNNLKDWGSEGQRKNAIISFKISQVYLIKKLKGYYPVLILDDLFSELDKEKITNLFSLFDSDIQTFITTTDLKGISKKVLKNARKFKVCNGTLEEEI